MDSPILWLAIGVVFGAALMLGLRKRKRAVRVDPSEIAQLRQNLRLKVMYNEAVIDRLIDLEREKTPKANLAQLMRNAIARWERDNR